MENEPQTAPPPSGGDHSKLTSWIVIAVVVVAGLIYLARQRRDMAVSSAAKGGTSLAMGALMSAGNVAGLPAPNWTLKQLDGQPLSLSQFKGKAVVLDFWASWCGPCKMEIPWWNDLQAKYRARGLQIIGISEDDNDKDVRDFLAKNRLDYPVVMDHNALAAAWGMPIGLPTTFFIRRDGTIAARVEGLEGEDELQRRIQGIL
ncbi:MAG: TlpA family protein disulfide reductase [Terriglobales bacterium]